MTDSCCQEAANLGIVPQSGRGCFAVTIFLISQKGIGDLTDTPTSLLNPSLDTDTDLNPDP